MTTLQDGEPFTVIDGNGGTIFGAGGFGGGGVRAELAPGATGKCNQFGVCQGTGLASHGGTHDRALTNWINLSAYGTVGPAGFTATGTPCIGGTVVGSCATSGGGTGF